MEPLFNSRFLTPTAETGANIPPFINNFLSTWTSSYTPARTWSIAPSMYKHRQEAAHSIAIGCSACSSNLCHLASVMMSSLRFFASATVSSLRSRSPMPVDTNPCLRLSL
ncbi:TPA: hypothetical protein ACH3X1_005887 [Trebouxia sp. C0004]